MNTMGRRDTFDRVPTLDAHSLLGKRLERSTNDAALKRAMLGREEAESEMRRFRDEYRATQLQLEESQSREARLIRKFEACQVGLDQSMSYLLMIPGSSCRSKGNILPHESCMG
jgi:hypothetical protein